MHYHRNAVARFGFDFVRRWEIGQVSRIAKQHVTVALESNRFPVRSRYGERLVKAVKGNFFFLNKIKSPVFEKSADRVQ